jgi:Skp family chaperone for outer membrane proteins
VHYRISIATIALMGLCAAPSVFGQAGNQQPNNAGAAAQPAAAGPKTGPTSIALVDVGYIIKNHPNMEANMAAIKAEMEQAQIEIENRRKSLLKDQEALGSMYEADSPALKAKQEQLISQESKLRVDFMGKEKEFAEKQATVIYKSYQSINRSIALLAKHFQYDLVLRYSREQDEMDPKKPQTVNFGVQRDVLFHNDQIDITELVLQVLNRDEPKMMAPVANTPGGAPSTASSAVAPGTQTRTAAPQVNPGPTRNR